MSDWRIEALNLADGLRKRVLSYASFDFEEKLNEVGTGTVTINVRSVNIADVWPHTTSIAFLRTAGPGATPSNPVCEFIGMVEAINPSSAGSLSIGVKSIEGYLGYRMINGELIFTGLLLDSAQTRIGAYLVNLAASNGVPLLGTADDSVIVRTRVYAATDWKKIGEAVQQLTEVMGGPDYELIHTQDPDGRWKTEMRFRDEVSNTPAGFGPERFLNVPSMNVRRGVVGYDLSVSGTEHANRVVGIGATPDLTYDADGSANSIYPLFERSEAYTDVTDLSMVQDNAQGAMLQNLHPTAIPSVTLAGLDIIVPQKVGNFVRLVMGHGAIQYRGVARIVGIAWSKGDDSPTTATLSMVPQDDAAAAILNAPQSDSGCCDEPAIGPGPPL